MVTPICERKDTACWRLLFGCLSFKNLTPFPTVKMLTQQFKCSHKKRDANDSPDRLTPFSKGRYDIHVLFRVQRKGTFKTQCVCFNYIIYITIKVRSFQGIFRKFRLKAILRIYIFENME